MGVLKSFDDLTNEEIDELSASEVKERERLCMEEMYGK